MQCSRCDDFPRFRQEEHPQAGGHDQHAAYDVRGLQDQNCLNVTRKKLMLNRTIVAALEHGGLIDRITSPSINQMILTRGRYSSP